MSYRHLGDETTTAPRHLTRSLDVDPAETTHSIWRCGRCAALAVGPHGQQPTACGKCKA